MSFEYSVSVVPDRRSVSFIGEKLLSVQMRRSGSIVYVPIQGFRGVKYLPDPSRIAWNPAFGEGHQLCAVGGSLGDNFACLVDGCFEIKPDGLGLGHGNTDLGQL